MQELVTAAVQVAQGAGALLRAAYQTEQSEVRHKSTAIDLVTDTDQRTEAYILSELLRRFPDHAVLAEETGAHARSGAWQWLVDPLDGTVNFAHRMPHFAVLLAVGKQSVGEFSPQVAVTYQPLTDELFVAVKGQGTTLNGRPVRVSRTTRLLDSMGATGFQYDRLFRADDNHREFCRLNLLTQGLRRAGSAGLDLAYVAAGRFDFYWEAGLKPWDFAGGTLLVEEAGGRVTALDGGPVVLAQGTALAANPALHPLVWAALREARALPAASRAGLAAHLPAEIAARLIVPDDTARN